MDRDPIAWVFAELTLGQKRHKLAEFRLADEQQEQPAGHLQHAIDTLDPDTDPVETVERGLQRPATAFILPGPRAGSLCALDCRGADPRPAVSVRLPAARAAGSCHD